MKRKPAPESMKEFQEKLLYDIKFAYVRTGHAKNELLGFLTVFNAKRSFNVRVKRAVQYAPDDKRLYLNIYEPSSSTFTAAAGLAVCPKRGRRSTPASRKRAISS